MKALLAAIRSLNAKIIEIERAKGCAWRALYVRVNGTQVVHIGVDPNNGTRPQMFGGFFLSREKQGRFRFRLPTVHWHDAQKSEHHMRAYCVMRDFWHNVDGRYGWGSDVAR